MYDLSYIKARNDCAAKKAIKHREEVLALDVEEVRQHFGDGLARLVEQQRQQLIGG
jgi:hypothetical protein